MLKSAKFGRIGLVAGSLALLIAVVDFWGGPFSAQPTFESSIADSAAALRQATLDALNGKDVKESYVDRAWDADRIIGIVIPVIGVIAIVLGVLSFVMHEPKRAAACAAALGVSAIAFQFFAMYAMALLAAFLILAVLSSIGWS